MSLVDINKIQRYSTYGNKASGAASPGACFIPTQFSKTPASVSSGILKRRTGFEQNGQISRGEQMTIKSAKNGYHSTQRTIYSRIPASEFYGFVLGIAIGYIVPAVINLSGIAEVNNSDFAIIFCIIGVAIGWWYDQKYFMVKDEPEEGAEAAVEGTEEGAAVSSAKAAEREVIEGTSTQDTLKQMFARNADDDEDGEVR